MPNYKKLTMQKTTEKKTRRKKTDQEIQRQKKPLNRQRKQAKNVDAFMISRGLRGMSYHIILYLLYQVYYIILHSLYYIILYCTRLY